MTKIKDVTVRFPNARALETLGQSQRRLTDYTKVLPEDLKTPQALPSTVLQLISDASGSETSRRLGKRAR